MITIRPQRDKRPPAWLEDFITGGELEESLAVQPETEIAAVHPIEMAQRQLEHPPAINIQDMWHLLPGEGLDISWLADNTRTDITDLFYSSTAQEGNCAVDNCSYSTLKHTEIFILQTASMSPAGEIAPSNI